MQKLSFAAAVLGAAALLSACAQPKQVAAAPVEETKAQPAPKAPAPATEPKPADAPADAPLPPVDAVDAAAIKKLLEGAKGKVAVVNFWATWCPPCVKEMPYFTSLHQDYHQKGVEVISISADGKGAIESAVKPYQKKEKLPFPIHVLAEPNPEALTEVVGKELTGALPETLVYDKTGKLVKIWEGEVTFAELEEAVKPLL